MAPKPRSLSPRCRPQGRGRGRWVHVDGVESEVARVLSGPWTVRRGPRPAVGKVDDRLPSSIRLSRRRRHADDRPIGDPAEHDFDPVAWYGCSSSSTQIPTVADPPAVSVPPGSRVADTPSHRPRRGRARTWPARPRGGENEG